MIVVEGIDNSGKSTLVSHLRTVLGYPSQESEGPPHYPGEMNLRVARYASLHHVIFDRHPVVSQTIYGSLRSHSDPIRPDLVQQFYDARPLFIYCDPGIRGMTGHVRRDTVDTDAHLSEVTRGYEQLLIMYRAWAIQHAHIIYRIGDDMDFIADCAQLHLI